MPDPRWSRRHSVRVYPRARRLLITADAGGSNGARLRLWKMELQNPASVPRNARRVVTG
jgi:hypothetical protein